MKVLYILGSARCGSTVLSNVLGEVPGVFSAGEVRFAWTRARQGRTCGCGELVSACPVWSRALAAPVPGEDGAPTPEDVEAWQDAALRLRQTRRILRGVDADPSAPIRRYVATMETVLDELASAKGAEVVVDASKRPSNGAALASMSSVEAYFLHLVRDPRAVAFSRSRPKPGPGGGLSQRSLTDSVLHWTATNLAADAVRRVHRDRSILLRYEDVVHEPAPAFSRILELIGSDAPSPVRGDGSVELHPNHNVSGNPDRFVSGEITLRSDDRWLDGLSARGRRFVSTATWPLMRNYGYAASATTAASQVPAE